MKNILIRAGMKREPLTNEKVGEFPGPGATGKGYFIQFSKSVDAEFITIQMKGTGSLQVNGLRIKEAGKPFFIFALLLISIFFSLPKKIYYFITFLTAKICSQFCFLGCLGDNHYFFYLLFFQSVTVDNFNPSQ